MECTEIQTIEEGLSSSETPGGILDHGLVPDLIADGLLLVKEEQLQVLVPDLIVDEQHKTGERKRGIVDISHPYRFSVRENGLTFHFGEVSNPRCGMKTMGVYLEEDGYSTKHIGQISVIDEVLEYFRLNHIESKIRSFANESDKEQFVSHERIKNGVFSSLWTITEWDIPDEDVARGVAMKALFSFLRIWDKSPAKVVRLAHDLNSDIRSLKVLIKSGSNIANLIQLKATVKWLEEFHHVAPLKDRFFGVAKFGFESFLVGFEPPINTECLSDL